MKCASCGGGNPSHAERCEYCGKPLQPGEAERTNLQLSARRDGWTAEGRVAADEPDSMTELRGVFEQFEEALRAVLAEAGPSAEAGAVEQALRARFIPSLSADMVLEELSVTAPAPKPPRTPLRASHWVMLGLTFVGLTSCCTLSLVSGFVSGPIKKTPLSQRARMARVVPAGRAGKSTGWVCVERTVAQVDSGLVVEGAKGTYLHVEDRRHPNGVRSVKSFKLGSLLVEPASNTRWGKLQPLKGLHGEELPVKGLPADRPITLIGSVKGGALTPGEPAVITAGASRQDVIDELTVPRGGNPLGTSLAIAIVLSAALTVAIGLYLRSRPARGTET